MAIRENVFEIVGDPPDRPAGNAYWEAVKGMVRADRAWGGPTVDPYRPFLDGPVSASWKPEIDRMETVSRWSWTITSPETVAFVAGHAGPRLLDPLAGSGWWAHLLAGGGLDVVATDRQPAVDGSDLNKWHRHGSHHPVGQADGVDAVTVHGAARTLLLSWPPYDDSIGADILDAYRGPRVIYIGEGPGGCCGDDRMFDLLDKGWVEAAGHAPVQWFGMHDHVTVYERVNSPQRGV